MFKAVEEMLLGYIHTLPLEVFVFFASIVEEVIAPIPSPTVMILSGSFAQVQGYGLWAIVMLALIGAAGKVLGALFVYIIADKGEDVLMRTCGRFFNVSHDDVERLGKKLRGGIRDYALLTFLRALPVMPSVVVSVGSGVLKIPLTLFIVSTFVGTIIRDGFYLYAGYAGTIWLARLVEDSTRIEAYVEALVIVFVVGLVLYLKYFRKRR